VGLARQSQSGHVDGAFVRRRIHTLPQRFRADAVNGFSAEYGLRIGDEGFRVSVAEGRCTVEELFPAFPTARITTDPETWLALDDGAMTSIEAFLAGRVAVRGHVDHAVRLQSLFRPSGRERTPGDLEHVDLEAGPHRLSAFVVGEGPPVLLLHGLGATKLSWLPLLGPLAERYRVIVTDLPGHGESDKPRGNYTPAFYAGVVRRLLDAIGEPRAALVGNSMGGRIALEVAARAPMRVSSLVLLGPAVAGLPFPYYARFLRLLPTEMGAIPMPMRRRLVMMGIRQLFGDPDRLPRNAYLAGADEFIRVYRSGRARVALLSSLRGLMADRAAAFWDKVRTVRAPTLILWGERDRLVPLRLGELLASSMPEAELAMLPDVGHVPQFEVPEMTIELVRGFLDRVTQEEPATSRSRKQAPRGRFGS
jgi:pimeloyl-ACP methyl ester carboxylesterase